MSGKNGRPVPATVVTVAGMLVALAAVGVTVFVVVALSASAPVVIAAVLASFAAVMGSVAPVIKALRGGQ